MSLQQTLDSVRASRGLPALPDPTRIQGFGDPGDAPSPQSEGLPPAIEVEHQPDAGDEFGIHDDPPPLASEAPPASPLFPTRRPTPVPAASAQEIAEQIAAQLSGGTLADQSLALGRELQGAALTQQLVLAKAFERAQATLPQTRLALLDKIGEWKGRPFILTEDEHQEVLEVVFRAMRRELDADLADVLGRPIPRRRRTRAKAAVAAATAKVLPTVEKPEGETFATATPPKPERKRRARRGSLLDRER